MRRLISNENNYNKLRTIVSKIVESVDLTIEPNNPEFYNSVQTRPVESWTKVKRYADIYEITSAQWKGKYNSAIHFPCRMSANVTGIFLPNVWKCLLQTFLTNDRQLFVKKVKGIDKEYDIEQEILCKGGNDYTIYNLKEIKKH